MIQAIRIGAYILVFIEKETTIKWESRLNMYDQQYRRNAHRHIPLNAYLALSLLCVVLSIAYTDYSTNGYSSITLITIQALLFVVSIIAFGFLSSDYITIKKDYIEQWTKIKETENAEMAKKSLLQSKILFRLIGCISSFLLYYRQNNATLFAQGSVVLVFTIYRNCAILFYSDIIRQRLPR